jgi:hypothetical protein
MITGCKLTGVKNGIKYREVLQARGITRDFLIRRTNEQKWRPDVPFKVVVIARCQPYTATGVGVLRNRSTAIM